MARDIPINYLDDFLFVALSECLCNLQVQTFMDICQEINFPVSLEKTFWSSTKLVFLGLLLNTMLQIVSVPVDKVQRALRLIVAILSKKKTMVGNLQKLTGYLNFLCRCIVPGHAFTQRLYSYFNSNMKQHHHVRVTSEMKDDLAVWNSFLNNPVIYCRPFIDFSMVLVADKLEWFTDASGTVGMGGIWHSHWFQADWDRSFLVTAEPSIEYLELFAVTVLVLLWSQFFMNKHICLFCDNQAVVHMINNSSSSCRQCMVLIRKITLKCLQHNVHIFAKYVPTHLNFFADALSRNQMSRFWKLAHKHDKTFVIQPTKIPEEIWPIHKVWLQ